MKYNETIAYQCRYGEVAERIGGGISEILWEQSYMIRAMGLHGVVA